MKNLYLWSKVNSLKAHPGKFQFLILENRRRYKYSLNIAPITVKESNKVELLGITFNKSLTF